MTDASPDAGDGGVSVPDPASPVSGIALSLNGAPVSIAMTADTPLLWALRDSAGLTGTKAGCFDDGCGACLLWLDDVPTPSCRITLGQALGRRVVTIEGARGPDADRLRAAFAHEGAVLCGHCTPAMLMAGLALLRVDGAPDDAAIDAAMTPECRCGAYNRIRAAIGRAAAPRGAAPSPLANPDRAAPGVALPAR